MTPRQLILVFCLIIFALLTSMTADAQAHWAAKTGASDPAPTAAPAPTAIPEPTKAPTPTARPALPRARIYLPLLHTVQRGAGEVFWADRYRLQPGECTQIHWAVTNYPSPVYAVYLNDMPVTGQDTRWVCPLTTAQYVLRVVRSTGTDWHRVTITVSDGSTPSIEFTADSYRVIQGQCTILRWRVTGARAVYLDHQGVAGEGVRAVCPAADMTYVLDVEFDDSTTASRSLTIIVTPTGAAVLRFWAEQYTLPLGACTTLHWKVQNVREVYLNDQGVPGVGAVQVCPDVSQPYTLRVVDWAGRSVEREIVLMAGDPELDASEVIAQGIVNDLIQAIDIDPGQPGDQPGYRLVIDGINALFTGTPSWGQAIVALGVPLSLIQSGQAGPVDWPIVPGQQVEFRAACDGPECVLGEASAAYLHLRSE
jgi:hypothetical protein